MDTKQESKGRFVQYPLHIIYGCPDLTRDDKWVLLAIMGECWTEGPHKLSYRDISRLSGVPISLLSSIKGKGGKPDKEGIIDRLVRMDFIKVTLGKEVKSGKACGNAQTYIHVNHKRIWEDNASYCEAKRSGDTREHYRCEEADFEPVSYTNRSGGETVKPVRIENEPVSYTNESVPNTNRPVSYTNEPVHDASSKVTPYITDIKITKDSNIRSSERTNESTTSTLQQNQSSLPVPQEEKEEAQQPTPSKKQATKGKKRKKDTISQKELPKLNEPFLSEKAKAVWNVWLNMPWNKEIPPRLTETAAKHCETLSKVNGTITEDIMFKIRNFAKKNDTKGFYEGKKWELGHMVVEYSKWKSSIYEVQVSSQEEKTRPSVLVSEASKQRNIEKLRAAVAAKGITL